MSSGSTYILEGGSAQSQLSSNTNKKVEVTGTLDTSMSGSSSGSGSTAGGTTAGGTTAGGTTSGAGTTGSASGSMAHAQHLRVSSVRVIGDSCR
jgi:hypothetical protein